MAAVLVITLLFLPKLTWGADGDDTDLYLESELNISVSGVPIIFGPFLEEEGPLSPTLFQVLNKGNVFAGETITVTGADFTPEVLVVLTSKTHEYVFLSSPKKTPGNPDSLSFVLTDNVLADTYVITVVNSNFERSKNLKPITLTVINHVLNAPLITIVNGKSVAASGDITIVRDSTVPIVVKIAGLFPGTIKDVYMRAESGDLYLFSPRSVTHESLSFQITASEDIVPSGIYKLYIQDDGQLLSNEVSIFLRAATEHHRGNECDLGYHEDVNGECVLDDVNPPPPPPPPPIDSGPLSQLVTCGFDLNKDGIVEGHTVDANGLQEECDFNALVRMAQRIINFLLYMSVAIAAAAFAMAGFKYVTARGNVGQIESAHKIFTNVLVGLLIALAAWLVINTVTSGLLGDNASKFRILKQQSR